MRFARLALTFTVVLASSAAIGAPRPATKASPPPLPITSPPPIMPIGQVRAGMKGYGLTVFRGTKIERFGFQVLGVLPKFSWMMGGSAILVRLTGGPITSRGAYLIQGMSGSPCYVNGRLIGAFSMGYPTPAKEPIGMLTPIEEMLEALDPKLPNRPSGVSEAEFGVDGTDSVTATMGQSAWPLGQSLLSAAPGMDLPGFGSLRPEALMTPIMVSGLSSRGFQILQNGLRPYRLAAIAAPGQVKRSGKPTPLEPGAAVGFQLASGDIDLTGVGTVTYRRGNQLLAFGHPMYQLGPVNFPMTTAYVHEVFPGLVNSFKIASPVATVGGMTQDRPLAVAARIGRVPPMIPITCQVDDQSTGRQKLFRARVVNHPLLSSILIPLAVNEAIYRAHPVPGDATARVRTEIATDGFGTITRENQVFDPVAIDMAALEDLAQGVDVLARNRFQRVPIKSLNVRVTIEAKRRTAAVERIFVRQEKFEPGETIEVGVVLRPYRGEPFTTKAQIKVPEYASNGRAVLMVSGGPMRAAAPGMVVVSGGGAPGMSAGSAGPNANSVEQLLQQYLAREKNNQIVTRIVFANPAVNVAGTTLSQLPSTLADVMRSSRSSGLRTDREEVKAVEDLDWLVSGAQSLPIQIERKDQSEKRTVESGTAKPSSGTSVADVPTPFSPSGTTFNAEDESVDPGLGGRLSSGPARFSEEAEEAGPDAGKPSGAGPVPSKSSGEQPSRSRRGRRAAKPAANAAPEATAKTEETPDTKLVGRVASRWTQSSQADFEKGVMQAVGVSAVGDIRLAPQLRVLHETPEQYIWSLAAGDGVTYAGTGNSGLIYRVRAEGEPAVFFKTGELEVHALARDRQGNLYAGTSPNGKVFRITPDGQGKELFALNPGGGGLQVPAPPARFILSLAVADDGTVYAGTGPEGRIYRITPDGRSSVFYQSPDQYVMSLLTVGDRVYAGTADSGLVYEIGPAGEARCVYDSDEKSITALARDREGRIYAASAPKGIIYRVAPGGAVTTVWDKSKGAVYALAATPDGDVYAACGNVLYRIGAGDKVTVLSDSKRAQFVALAADGTGRLFAGSANVGTLYGLETATSGSYESAVHDAKTASQWGQIRWVASLPEGGALQFETRSGSTPDPDATWSEWAPVVEAGSGTHVASPTARFLQYRVKLSGGSASPILRQVVVSYLPRNQAPTLALAAPGTGEFWRGAKEIKWTGSDPDKDTLTYEVLYSADNGKSWKRIGEKTQAPPKSEPKPETPEAVPAKAALPAASPAGPNSTLARFRQDLAAATELSEEDRRQALQQADELLKQLEEKPMSAPPEPPSSPEETKSETGITRESSLRWDTTQVPDGTYLVKVIASDRASNPNEPLADEAISDPVTVSNRPPQLVSFSQTGKVGTDRTALIVGIAEARAPIQGAQYRIDSGDWIALVPTDGIWDGRIEPWTLKTAALSRGKHRVELKLVDVAGNVTTKSMSVEVP